jgi:hypothetical protein
MEAVVAKVLKDRFFIGDFGLATVGDDFVSVFIQPDDDNVTSTFFHKVSPSLTRSSRESRGGTESMVSS